MGLRDRLKAGVKRVLERGGEAPAAASVGKGAGGAGAPAAPMAHASLEVSSRTASPTAGARVPPAPAAAAPAVNEPPPSAAEAAPDAKPLAIEPAPATEPPAPEALPEAAPVVETTAAETPPPAAELAPPVAASAPLPASALPRSVISDNDAPLRDAHIRASFATTDKAFHVRLVNEALGLDLVVPCEPGEYVLDAADRAGHELPSSCRNGGCLTCAGKLLEGDTEMEEQYTLEEEHIAMGFRLLCCTRVTSDAVFVTHQQEEIA